MNLTRIIHEIKFYNYLLEKVVEFDFIFYCLNSLLMCIAITQLMILEYQ